MVYQASVLSRFTVVSEQKHQCHLCLSYQSFKQLLLCRFERVVLHESFTKYFARSLFRVYPVLQTTVVRRTSQ